MVHIQLHSSVDYYLKIKAGLMRKKKKTPENTRALLHFEPMESIFHLLALELSAHILYLNM